MLLFGLSTGSPLLGTCIECAPESSSEHQPVPSSFESNLLPFDGYVKGFVCEGPTFGALDDLMAQIATDIVET